MKPKILLSITGAVLIALSSPALAGKPAGAGNSDNAGRPAVAGKSADAQCRRGWVRMNRELQQNLNGPSGFGERISLRSTNKSATDPYANFGDYLKSHCGS